MKTIYQKYYFIHFDILFIKPGASKFISDPFIVFEQTPKQYEFGEIQLRNRNQQAKIIKQRLISSLYRRVGILKQGRNIR